MTKLIEKLTKREVIIPEKGKLDDFVNDWTKVMKEGQAAELVKEAIYKVARKAYFGDGGKLYIEEWIKPPVDSHKEYLRARLKELGEIKKKPFQKIVSFVYKPTLQMLEEEIKSTKIKVDDGEKRLSELRESYKIHREPYEIAAKKLASVCGIEMKEVYKELDNILFHLPM